MPATSKQKPNVSQLIRDYLAQNPDMKPQEIQAALRKDHKVKATAQTSRPSSPTPRRRSNRLSRPNTKS